MRRTLVTSAFLVMAAWLGTPNDADAAPMVVRWGDADLNGAVTMADAGQVLDRILAGTCRLSNEGVSNDARLGIADAMLVAQRANSARPAASLTGDGTAPFTLAAATGGGQIVASGNTAPVPLTTQATHKPLTGACLDMTLLKQNVAIQSDTTGGALLTYNAANQTQFDQVAFSASGLSSGVQVTMGPLPGTVVVRATVSYALADGTGQVNTNVLFTLTTLASCGNGTLEPGEVCDDGPGEGNGLCLDDCSGLQTCGDGVRNGNEQCEDSNTKAADGCSPVCQYENLLCGNAALNALAPAFAPELVLGTGAGPKDARVADLDGDGFDDIVVANATAGTLSVYLGNGDGSFSTEGVVPAPGDPTQIQIADLDGDAQPDLVVLHTASNQIASYIGLGDGSFQLPPTITTYLVSGPSVGVSGDFDAVGGDDFAFLDATPQVVSMRNMDCCGGLLEVNNAYGAGLGPMDIQRFAYAGALADDLLVVNRDEHSVQIFPNLGGYSGFGAPVPLLLDTNASREPVAVVVGEVDGDNDLYWDIITADNAAPPYSGFTRFSLRRKGVILGPFHIPSSARPNSIVLADVNDDGHQDIVATHTGAGNQVGLYLGDGAGTFAPAVTVTAGSDPRRSVVGDFDQDGLEDLVLVNGAAPTVSVLMNRVRGEQCDDGNRVADDGCDAYCQLESPGGVCGDGVANAIDEGCDDSENGVQSDDCMAGCVAPFCGDGVQKTSGPNLEACDTGMANDNLTGNACREDCTLPYCGDGVLDTLYDEECDNGAANSNTIPNGCYTTCRLPYCGDGKRDDFEECDDGNLAIGDGCDGVCRVEITPEIPDTGQTACYNNSSSMTCPADGAAFSRQDAQVDRPGPSFAAIYTSTVIDGITGLMWERNASATSPNRWDAQTYCNNLALDGFNDWRLPTLHELVWMASYGGSACPYFPATFGGPACGNYWSSTQHSNYDPGSYSYRFDFNTGESVIDWNGYGYYTRCVRGTGPDLGQMLPTGVTVTDTANHLMWQPGANGTAVTWSTALGYCRDLTLGGYTDWRLPDMKELMSIVDLSNTNPSIEGNLFPGSGTEFWTSTTQKTNPANTFRVRFNYYGYIQSVGKTGNNGQARCVRDALVPTPNNAVLETGEQCDDGKHCEDGTPCLLKADCTAVGSFNCLPRDGDGCDINGQCTGGDCSSLCGDGVINTTAETCDDGNNVPYDGCGAQCLEEIRPSLLPDTGEEQCYATIGAPVSCAPPSGSGGGEDGYYERTPLNFTVSETVVTDNNTGLMWEQTPATSGSPNWSDANNSCLALSKGGYDDWRLPSIDELVSLADWGDYYCPLISKSVFGGTNCDFYWSSTPYPTDVNYAWGLEFNEGTVTWNWYGYGYRVRCVRGPAYTHGDYQLDGPTVTDRETGLMWQAAVSPTATSWTNALAYCNNLSLAGYDNWRLPDARELRSLVAESYYNPPIETVAFGYSTATLWSSTSFVRDWGASAYYLRMTDGYLGRTGKTTNYNARCVRDDFWTAAGNGVIDATEECDDANLVNGDGCDNDGGCTGGSCAALCGNGSVDSIDEECDDANANPADGCDTCLKAVIPSPLADTGQPQCYNNGNLIPCPPPTDAFGGQDGFYPKTPPSFTVNGPVVHDNITGLDWEQTPVQPGSPNWTDANNTCAGLVKGGFDDWRMPNIIELESIIHWGRQFCPLIDTSIFGGQACDQYWSSTEWAGDPVSYAWGFNFNDPDMNVLWRGSGYRIRCVRGTPLKYEQYRNNGVTVTDRGTGLMWQAGVAATGQTWQAALATCNNLSLDGYSDWRLPDVRELYSLRSTTTYGPMAPYALFGTTTGGFWSSTSQVSGYGSQAMWVGWNDADMYHSTKTTLYNVRCVRDSLHAVHGNGIVEADEQCDDGNTVNTDSCANDGVCPGGDCSPLCGNGIFDAAAEVCDDANTNPYDGCANCQPVVIPTALADTGQERCYLYGTANVSECRSPADASGGQDGWYQRTPPSFTVNGAVVVDNNTGLMWEQTPATSGSPNWTDSNNSCNALVKDGFDDWRLPNTIELLSIMDYGVFGCPFIDTSVFGGTNCDWYWASDRWAGDLISYHWQVNFGDTSVGAQWNGYGYRVRCVRGAPLAYQDYIPGINTHTDKSTGIMWQAAPDTAGKTWTNALAYCNALTLDDYDDWRLPDIRELGSLRSPETKDPAVDAMLFGTSASRFWSSTNHEPGYSANAYFHQASDGYMYHAAKTSAYAVRCMRYNRTYYTSNGVLDPGEDCDDGKHCTGGAEDGLSCALDDRPCLNGGGACGPRSGDGCENDGTCTGGDCTVLCGDGTINAAIEECDDGNVNPYDGCQPDCTPAIIPSVLAETGQVLCFGSPPMGSIQCLPPSQPLGGQDGYYQRTPLDFTSDGTVVTDNNTGLVWEQTPAYTSTYNWWTADGNCAALSKGGFDDWRLPSMVEYSSIANWGVFGCPMTTTSIFGGTNCDWYWSTDRLASDITGSHQVFGFQEGYSSYAGDGNGYRMRCVRGAPLQYADYRAQGQTVSDRSTGLMWQAAVSPSNITWAGALSYCNSLALDGYDDWRLPDVRELYSIVDQRYFNPAVDAALLGTATNTLWTATSFGPDSVNHAHYVDFSLGMTNRASKTTATYRARCVRDDLWQTLGNGRLEGSEACDDGNLMASDGCEPDGTCTGGSCAGLCGDGIVNTVQEACDDGNLLDNDGCSPNCQKVPAATLLADSGQSLCFNTDTATSCLPPSTSLGGQDGWYARTPMDFSLSGNNMVVDGNTGLVWQRGDAPTTYNYSNSFNYCDGLVLDGFTNWRLPTEHELLTLTDYGQPGVAINALFTGTDANWYWSQTRSAGNLFSWHRVVNFDRGTTADSDNSTGYQVRCVRGAILPLSEFIDQGTVVRDTTWLNQWQADADGVTRIWTVALAYCNDLVLAGRDDWRLPDIRELALLPDSEHNSPALSTEFFSGAPTGTYWSATSSIRAGAGDSAFSVSLSSGSVGETAKGTASYVRCIRPDFNGLDGNGVVDADEECDDGNLTDGDGCQANGICTVAGCASLCGNGLLDSHVEECEDGNSLTNDGCVNCLRTPIVSVLADTNQEMCFDNDSPMFCDSPTVAMGGQDGYYVQTPPAFTVGSSVVVDTRTGLTWERSPSFGSTYNWGTANSNCDGLVFAGFNDWRLPSAQEMMTITDYRVDGAPSINTSVFSGMPSEYHWTSTTRPTTTDRYVVGMSAGDLSYAPNGNGYRMRCVRGTAWTGTPSLVARGPLAVDKSRQLIWHRLDSMTSRTWAQSLDYCNSLVVEGHTGWRLPSVREGMSLLNLASTRPSINSGFFSLVGDGGYWTSTTNPAGSLDQAFHINYWLDGIAPTGVKTGARRVMCVHTLMQTCGNGTIELGEGCDDGNTATGDGCGATCLCETAGCPELCGNGVLDAQVEKCDDGNTSAGDGCRADCRAVEGCGNGYLDAALSESCDDGYTDACGTCDATCTGPGSGATCADGSLCPQTETCDDNNTAMGDGCTCGCQVEKPFSQWAADAPAFSSQYSTGGYSALQATGAPTITVCGDNGAAWTSTCANCGNQWIELAYSVPVYPSQVRVHESYNPGGLVLVEAYPYPSGSKITLWSGTDPNAACPGTSVINVSPACGFQTNRIRITVNTNLTPSWDEIDAVQLVGFVSNVCGDGNLQGFEYCDDGNAQSGDGCNSTCTGP